MSISDLFFNDGENGEELEDQEFGLGTRERPLEVSELTDRIKAQLEGGFADIVLVGEISNFKAHPSGHHYFVLKDADATISAVMFRGANSKLKFKLENGLRILAFGRISVYPPRGSYQIVLSSAEPEGLGSLQLAFDQLKQKLSKEGLFDEARKKPIPKFPASVAVVTAKSGAAIRDILNILDRRFSGLEVLIYPVKVQGDGSAQEIAQAIRDLNQFFPQVEAMIVGRGGGSLEDLWAFNEEVVARAIADSEIPIISAVGHEVDFSISDFVADLRAPTPSAAAELVISSKLETIRHLDHLTQRLLQFTRRLEFLGMRIDDLTQKMARVLGDRFYKTRLQVERLQSRLQQNSPVARVKEYRYRLDQSTKQLVRIPERLFERKKSKVESLESKLRLLNPKSIMERGYSLVRHEKTGKIIRKASDVSMGDQLIIELSKGKIKARV